MTPLRPEQAGRSRGRRAVVAVIVGVLAAGAAATAQADHGPFFGGDAGRSGYQPVDPVSDPLTLKYSKTGTDANIRTSIVDSAGVVVTGYPSLSGQRMAYGTEAATAASDGNVHLQLLASGAPVGPEAGVPIDELGEDTDTFTGLETYNNLQGGSVTPADSSVEGGSGQLYVLHNDDDQDGTNDIAIAQIDESNGLVVQQYAVPGTNGYTVSSSPVLSAPDGSGNRALYFVARNPAQCNDPLGCPPASTVVEARLYRVQINAASTVGAHFPTTATTSKVVPGANPLASPTLVDLPTIGTYVAVSTNSTNTVRTYKADQTLEDGPRSVDLGDDGQTPSARRSATGEQVTGGTSPLYVAVGQTSGTTANANTRVFELTYVPGATPPGTASLQQTDDSELLQGQAGPALSVTQTAEAGSGGFVAVTTGRNFYSLRVDNLKTGNRLAFGDNLTAGTTGFSRTAPATSDERAFVSRDCGEQLVINLTTAQIAQDLDDPNTSACPTGGASRGQPAISHRFVQYPDARGAFVYQGAKNRYALTVSKPGTGAGTVTSSPEGISCGADCSEDYDDGTTVTLTATPATGSTFAGWSGGGCTGTATCSVTMDAAKNVTATFTLAARSLTVTKPGNGGGTVASSDGKINCGSTCSATYDFGSSATLTATAAPGSTFAGWSGGGCSGTAATCNVTMTADTTVTATFTLLKRSLSVTKGGTGVGTVTSSPAGISCGADCSEDYDHGQVVTLTAAAASGSTFAGWSGACTGAASTCTMTMEAATSVSATFNPVVTGGGGGGAGVLPPPGCTKGGTDASEIIHGTEGDDIICGLGGNDTIHGLGGNDRLIGGTGNDVLLGGAGRDTLLGEFGDDKLDGGADGDNLVGSDGLDRLLGGAGGDKIQGGAANDVLSGGGGGDRLDGDAGNDKLTGGSGSDTINGFAGADTIYARDKTKDMINGGAGKDRAQVDKKDRLKLVEKRF